MVYILCYCNFYYNLPPILFTTFCGYTEMLADPTIATYTSSKLTYQCCISTIQLPCLQEFAFSYVQKDRSQIVPSIFHRNLHFSSHVHKDKGQIVPSKFHRNFHFNSHVHKDRSQNITSIYLLVAHFYRHG